MDFKTVFGKLHVFIIFIIETPISINNVLQGKNTRKWVNYCCAPLGCVIIKQKITDNILNTSC